MTLDRNFINDLLAAMLADGSAITGINLTLGIALDDLSDLDIIKVVTQIWPSYDSFLLDYLEDGVGKDFFESMPEPFATLGAHTHYSDPDCAVFVEVFRQFALLGKKLVLPFEGEKEAFMLSRFRTTDRSLPVRCYPVNPVVRLARQVIVEALPPIAEVFEQLSNGAGAVADRVPQPLRWETSLKVTPAADLWSGVSVDWKDAGLDVEYIESYTSRIALVPKDARGPRIICMEQHGLMLLQQSVMRSLYQHFNENPLTRGRVNVEDQQINQDLARLGSCNREVATLDMAEASDRVSLALVRSLFPPEWSDLLTTLRATKCEFPDGSLFTMRKFAPMGSALCFPIETLVFWALSAAAIAIKYGCKVEKAASLVTVHGDDTIVPTDCYECVSSTLEQYDLKVNREKSFARGFFRESCGGDFFFGHDVGPVRWNRPIFEETPARERLEYMPILRNSFYKKGWWYTARALVPSPTTVTPIDSPLPGSVISYCFQGGTFIGFGGSAKFVIARENRAKQVKKITGVTYFCMPLIRSYAYKTRTHRQRPRDIGRLNEYWARKRTEAATREAEYYRPWERSQQRADTPTLEPKIAAWSFEGPDWGPWSLACKRIGQLNLSRRGTMTLRKSDASQSAYVVNH